jgi:hypothetical protein
MTIKANGYVGIGTTTPSYKLEVVTPSTVGMRLQTSSSTVGSPQLDFLDAARGAETVISSTDGATTGTYIASYSNHPLMFGTNAGSAALAKMTIFNNGNVGIGTSDPKGYKLAVAGNMVAESVKVALQPNWPDYVFEPEYKLLSLPETEKFIKENKHLPEIPSAATVAETGLNLGEMNAKLLKKIEELTLHLINQDKKFEELKAEFNQYKKQKK